MLNKKIIVFGTRPEFIKLMPVFREIDHQQISDEFIYVFTRQHTALAEELFSLFNFKPHYTLKNKNHENAIGASFAQMLSCIEDAVSEIKQSFNITMIIGQGDTTTCACAAMSAFFNKIPFAHIE